RITLELRQGATVLASDRVTVRVAPWVMPSHLDPTIETYVMRMTGFNDQFVTDLVTAHSGSGVSLRPIGSVPFSDDQWVQDTVEVGFNAVPLRSSHVALKAIRFRGLEPFAHDVLLGPDYGFTQISAAVDTTFDSHGNLEVSPPVTVGGKEFKLGRIYH